MWTRRATNGLLVLSFLLAVAGCGSGSPKDAGDWNYNPPADFVQQDKQKDGKTVFIGPADSGFKANLMVEAITNSSQDAKQLGQGVLDKVTSGSDVTVKEQEPYKVADSDAYTWMISKKLPSGIVADQRQFIVKKNNVAVRFTLTAAESSMGKWDQALADSLQSFKWGRSGN